MLLRRRFEVYFIIIFFVQKTQFLLLDTTGRQGSVSVTDRGYSATVSTLRVVRDSVVQSVLLGKFFKSLKTFVFKYF